MHRILFFTMCVCVCLCDEPFLTATSGYVRCGLQVSYVFAALHRW